jgi:hypothetical protein
MSKIRKLKTNESFSSQKLVFLSQITLRGSIRSYEGGAFVSRRS